MIIAIMIIPIISIPIMIIAIMIIAIMIIAIMIIAIMIIAIMIIPIMIIPTYSTKNSFNHKILKSIFPVEAVAIIIFIFNINIIYQLQNNQKTMAFTRCLRGHCRFNATEFCTAVCGPTVSGHQTELFVFYAKKMAKWPKSTIWSYVGWE